MSGETDRAIELHLLDTAYKQVEYHRSKIYSALELYIKVTTGVVAGAAWLSTQTDIRRPKSLILLSDGLMVFMAVFVTFLITEHGRSWFKARKVQHELCQRIPSPIARSRVTDWSIAGFCNAFAIAFIIFNPISA